MPISPAASGKGLFMNALKFAASIVTVSLLALLLAWRWYGGWLDTPLALDKPVAVEMRSGSTLGHFARQLANAGIIDRPALLNAYGRLQGTAASLQAGEYRIEPGVTPRTLYQLLRNGRVIEYRVTIVEGWTTARMLSELAQQQKLIHSLTGVGPDELLHHLAIDSEADTSEGLFFPDTYVYRKGTRDTELLRQAFSRMQGVLQREWNARDSGLPYKSAYEALIMASLVEKEAGLAAERAQIAGVFVRRLQRGMKLQTDPAVIYGLGESYSGNLTRAHLAKKGPYNTYTNHGLPPTPIALAGEAALQAAVHPAAGSALYFVARGDGSHQFSDDLAAHQAAVRRLQITRRATNYRSQPSAAQPSGEG